MLVRAIRGGISAPIAFGVQVKNIFFVQNKLFNQRDVGLAVANKVQKQVWIP